jgi:hypothetical protein
MNFYLDSEEIRSILQNAGKIKKDGRCIHCNGTGYQNWNEEGGDIKPGKRNSTDRCDGECEDCEGVGFIGWQ